MPLRKKQLLGLGFLVTVCVALGVYRNKTSVSAKPVLSLDFAAKAPGLSGLGGIDFPSKGFNRAAATDGKAGEFYVLTAKSDAPAPPIVQLLTADADGHIESVVPLRRPNGRFVRELCYFLAVAPSGRQWWTVRKRHPSELSPGENSYSEATLAVHDQSGKILQEWKMTCNPNDVYTLQAVGEDHVYTTGADSKVFIYRRGEKQPQEVPHPKLYANYGMFITPEAEFLGFQEQSPGQMSTLLAKPPAASRVFNSFPWPAREARPFVFSYQPQAGVFVYQFLTEPSPTSTPPRRNRPDRSKAIYRIAPDGQMHKLFETPDVLPSKPGYQLKTGQPLKADDKYVWLEFEYLKARQAMEYQIVKIPYQAR